MHSRMGDQVCSQVVAGDTHILGRIPVTVCPLQPHAPTVGEILQPLKIYILLFSKSKKMSEKNIDKSGAPSLWPKNG